MLFTVAYQGQGDESGLLQVQTMRDALFVENFETIIKPTKILCIFYYHHVLAIQAIKVIKILVSGKKLSV